MLPSTNESHVNTAAMSQQPDLSVAEPDGVFTTPVGNRSADET